MNFTELKQALFELSQQDWNVIDTIMDPLIEQGWVEKVLLRQSSVMISSAFMIWKEEKSRVVMDLQKVNTKLYSDAYSLSKQNAILDVLEGTIIFSSMDVTKDFFQQSIWKTDHWKTAFVTPHCGHEQLTVSIMELTNFSEFFQHCIKDMLQSYLWKFLLIYVNNIIIFSESLKAHLQHVDQTLYTLKKSEITLSLSKCHFKYPSIKMLKHYVFCLGLNTVEEKTEIIHQMKFSWTLQKLKTELDFFRYYCKFVSHFVAIAESLIWLKTQGFKEELNKRQLHQNHVSQMNLEELTLTQIKKNKICHEAWNMLKNHLCKVSTLTFSDFSWSFILYMDGSKKMGYEVVLHQLDKNSKTEWSILFLLCCLNTAEQEYWSTELETSVLVWALIKLSQYFDQGQFTVYTDYSALKSALQTKTKNQRSNRLNEWAMYLFIFLSWMNIIHQPEKSHSNADELLWLLKMKNEVQTIYSVLMVHLAEEEKKVIVNSLVTDKHFEKIIQILMKQVKWTQCYDHT